MRYEIGRVAFPPKLIPETEAMEKGRKWQCATGQTPSFFFYLLFSPSSKLSSIPLQQLTGAVGPAHGRRIRFDCPAKYFDVFVAVCTTYQIEIQTLGTSWWGGGTGGIQFRAGHEYGNTVSHMILYRWTLAGREGRALIAPVLHCTVP